MEANQSSGDQHVDKAHEGPTTSPPPATGFSTQWSKFIKQHIHKPVMVMIQFITQLSARNPKRVIGAVVTLSLVLLIIGLATNFTMDVDEDEVCTLI